MKVLASLLLLAVFAMLAVEAYVAPVQKPFPKVPRFPTFPGQGPFNPNAGPIRVRRSPQDNGSITVNAQKQGGKTSWGVDAQQKVWGNEHGSINVNAGANKQPGSKTQGEVGISGTFHW